MENLFRNSSSSNVNEIYTFDSYFRKIPVANKHFMKTSQTF